MRFFPHRCLHFFTYASKWMENASNRKSHCVYKQNKKKKTTGKKPFTRIVSFSIDAWCVQYLFFRALLESRQIYVCWMVGCSCNWIDGNHLKFLDCLCYLLFFFLLLFISFFLISKHSILFGHSWIGFQGKMRYKKCVKLSTNSKQNNSTIGKVFLFYFCLCILRKSILTVICFPLGNAFQQFS